MISYPEHGWCNFKLGDFEGTPSYLTDVPIDLLDAFIGYYTMGSGVAVFDEEGSYFTLLLSRYNHGIYIIEEKDSAILHDFSNMNISDLAENLIIDITTNLNSWCNDFYIMYDDPENVKQFKCNLEKKIEKLKNLI